MHWIWWYAPWPFLDDRLKLELLLWLAALGVSVAIWTRTIVLGRPWLRLNYMRAAPPPPPPAVSNRPPGDPS